MKRRSAWPLLGLDDDAAKPSCVAWHPSGSALAVTLPDPYQDEERWRTIGSPSRSSDVVLFVVHTWPEEAEAGDEVGRIISARKSTRLERKAYEEGTF